MKYIPTLKLDFYTYSVNSSIFDYQDETTLNCDKNFETIGECNYYCRPKYSIYYKNDSIINYKDHTNIDEDDDILFKARKSKNNSFELIKPLPKKSSLNLDYNSKLDGKMWLTLPSENDCCFFENKNEQYNLLEGDIIKIGLKMYEIIKKNVNTQNYIENENVGPVNHINEMNKKFGRIFSFPFLKKVIYEENNNNEKYVENKDFDENKACRICYSSHSSKDDPKILLCKCNSFAHYKCLKLYLKTSMSLNNNITSYRCENFNCEKCENPYPLKFQIKFNEHEIKTYSFIDIKQPPKFRNYIVLESLPYIVNNKNIKNIFVVNLKDNETSIGSDKNNDIIDCDLSVSSLHAILKFDKNSGKLNIINKSRFGTLVLIKDNIKLKVNEKIYFQVRNTYIKAEIKGKSNDNNDEIDKNKEFIFKSAFEEMIEFLTHLNYKRGNNH